MKHTEVCSKWLICPFLLAMAMCLNRRAGRPWNYFFLEFLFLFLLFQLKILHPHWSRGYVWFPLKMVLADMHTRFFWIATPQARSLSQRGYLNPSCVIIEPVLNCLASCPFLFLDCFKLKFGFGFKLGNLGKGTVSRKD